MNVVKLPYAAARRVHSQMPRRSKNGTPKEREAKRRLAATASAEIIELPSRGEEEAQS